MTRVAGSSGGVAAEPVRPRLSTRSAAIWSVTAHVMLIGGTILLARLAAPVPMPPAFSVELVAAPAGPRALGAVRRGPTVPASPTAEERAEEAAAREPVANASPGSSERRTVASKRPVSTPSAPAVRKPVAPSAAASARKPSTSVPAPKSAAPKSGGDAEVPGPRPAGGGAAGGRGRDVASVKVQGIAFPYPGYLENITRQIALNFRPKPGVGLKAEVAFLIHRDGSISELRLLSRSGAYAFDLECIGAVEAVGQRKSFGALPSGFRDDVLPVVFSFDPTVLR